jgi:zinc D-Ala-D-Ala carboxypeptidase
MTQLTNNFTLEEMTRSEYATRNGLNNTPNSVQLSNLTDLCKMLELIRSYLDAHIRITSGYRSVEVNVGIGGSKTSQHCYGQAADIETGHTTKELYGLIKDMVQRGLITVGQLICEFADSPTGGWVHISLPTATKKNEFLIATKIGGKTVYTKD